MCSMQGSSGEAEPTPPSFEGKFQDIYVEAAVWLIRFGAVIYLFSLLTVVWNDDEVKLHLLHGMTRICQALARNFGLWALQCENAYNEYVDTLH